MEPENFATSLGWIFHVGVLLYLLKRGEISEFKLSWLIILLLFPVLGAFMFMLLSSNDFSKKITDRYERALMELKAYQRQISSIDKLREQDTEAYVLSALRISVGLTATDCGTDEGLFTVVIKMVLGVIINLVGIVVLKVDIPAGFCENGW